MTTQQTIFEIDKVTAQVKSAFSYLSAEQLNWKPVPDKWSVAQCLHHLMVSNQTYYPQFEEIISGKHENSFYQNIKLISRFFGNYLIRETGAVVSTPMKHPGAFAPSQSHIPISIISDFEKHQQQLSVYISGLSGVDLERTVVSSPALKIITYNLDALLTILIGHEQRHLAQAKNLLTHPKFPN